MQAYDRLRFWRLCRVMIIKESPNHGLSSSGIFFRSNAPVTVDGTMHRRQGCTVCVDVCPMDLLAINPATQKAYIAFDECGMHAV